MLLRRSWCVLRGLARIVACGAPRDNSGDALAPLVPTPKFSKRLFTNRDAKITHNHHNLISITYPIDTPPYIPPTPTGGDTPHPHYLLSRARLVIGFTLVT